MLISGFPTVGLKIDETLVEGGVAGYVLIVGPDGELTQMVPMVTGFGYAEDDGVTVRADGSEHDRHLVFLGGDRTFDLSCDEIGQETVVIVAQGGEGGHTLTWPAGVAWKDGEEPQLATARGRTTIVRLLKIGDGEWLGWSDGNFF